MRKFFQYVKVILLWVPKLLWYTIFRFNRYLRHPEKYTLEEEHKTLKIVAGSLFKHFHVKFIVEGYENVSNLDGKAYFVINHLSEIDPIILMTFFDKPITFVAKKEMLKMPFIGKISRIFHAIAIERENVMAQLSDIKRIVNLTKDENEPLLGIFPEGTRNREPRNHCLEFKGGSIKMGCMAKVPIIPVSMWGSFRILNIHSYLKEYPIHIKIGEPIMPETYSNMNSVDLADQIRNDINKNVDEYRILDKEIILKQRLNKRRKAKEIKADELLSA